MKFFNLFLIGLFLILGMANAQELNDVQKQFIPGQELLTNPGFESGKTGWTTSGVTPTSSTSTVIKGKRSLCFTASSQSFTLSQDSTAYASQLADGVQGLIYLRVKSSHTGAGTICSKSAGTASTTNCITVVADNKWKLYKLPVVLGGTSNGLVASFASGTGSTCFDDGSLAIQDIKVDGITENIQESFLSQTASFGAAAITGALGTSTGSGNYTYNSSTGVYTMSVANKFCINASITASTATSIQVNIIKNGSTVQTGASGTGGTGYSGHASYCSKLAAGDTISVSNAAGSTNSQQIKVTSVATSSSANYSTVCGTNCVDSFSANVGATTGPVSGENIDWINGNCAVTDTSLFTCTFNTGIFTAAPNCSIGLVNNDNTVSVSHKIVSVSSTAIAIRTGFSNTGSGFTKSADIPFFLNCQKQGADFVASKTIYGNFAEMKSVASRGTISAALTLNNSTDTQLTFDTSKSFDTHGSLNASTGVFTAPVDGYYSVKMSLMLASASWTSGNIFQIFVKKNGTTYSTLSRIAVAGSLTQFLQANGTDDIYLSRGDTLTFWAFQVKGASILTHTDPTFNYVSITRVGAGTP